MNGEFERQVMRSLGNIEGTLQSVLREQSSQKEYIVAVSRRVGKLEQYRARVAGIAAAIGATVGAAFSIFLRIFN